MSEYAEWEVYAYGCKRLKVEGGHLYSVTLTSPEYVTFVPDVDLSKYQSHLRDAYNQGFKDGRESQDVES